MSYTLSDLKKLMACLRDPGAGCPWDCKQSWDSVVPHTVEELYELVDAIENRDWDNTREELGDLLFQIIFYCQLAVEEQRFSLDDVINEVVEKLLRRHPHVFPDQTLESFGLAADIDTRAVELQWESIKKKEKGLQRSCSALDGVPASMPALGRAMKLQKKASRVGFDWADSKDVMLMLNEEIDELHEAMGSGDADAMDDELGDVLFTVVNLIRHHGRDADQILRAANRKFETRFRVMEELVLKEGSSLADMSLQEQDVFWQQAKGKLRDPGSEKN